MMSFSWKSYEFVNEAKSKRLSFQLNKSNLAIFFLQLSKARKKQLNSCRLFSFTEGGKFHFSTNICGTLRDIEYIISGFT